MMKPATEIGWSPQTCGPSFATADHRRAAKPPRDDAARPRFRSSPFDVVVDLVDCGVLDWTWNLPSEGARARRQLVRHLARDRREPERLVACALRQRAWMEAIDEQAARIGFATSKTLNSGYTSCPTDASVAIALSRITKAARELEVSSSRELEPLGGSPGSGRCRESRCLSSGRRAPSTPSGTLLARGS